MPPPLTVRAALAVRRCEYGRVYTDGVRGLRGDSRGERRRWLGCRHSGLCGIGDKDERRPGRGDAHLAGVRALIARDCLDDFCTFPPAVHLEASAEGL